MRDAWRLAFGTFTALPVRHPGHVDRSVLGRAMLLAPLTTAPSALVWLGLGVASSRGWAPAAVTAVLALVVTALASRALHLDGLADLADGLTSGHDPARSLAVMRRGDTGPAGAAAVVLALLLDSACLAVLFTSTRGAILAVVALAASRLACAVCAREGIRSARPDGLGQGVAGTVARASLIGLVVLAASVAALVGAGVPGGQTGVPRWATALAGGAVVLCAAGAALVTRRHAVRRLGGITGDVIGAALEIALSAGLVTAAVVVTALPHP
ncbi:adenosylcobinamide-GDP ribazoletransferase [Terrabacter aerolatus]|uniref:Adenosylcobinamide-GDP ribazoletransferase n=1 Tax=Terrabacter aerolatus TaxID=422442 RepID=A0A512CYR3_9MICO|nr:adenosylcobinamide-GDP ribazoletransferase [Terrabacter aerolatus]GEO29352.1 adenosylcobinamide-GDP ribazoletransferase [Terrabacter aerolatus]